jgi:hypothetical protein
LFFSGIVILYRDLSPAFDLFLLGISTISLTAHHYRITGMREFLPGSRPEHDAPEMVSRNMVRLLLEGIGSQRNGVNIKTHQGDLST